MTAVICEYNPFHNGHAAHLEMTRAQTDGPIVCVMSGRFVQRGELAIVSKHTRAEIAVRCGADLVVELPMPYALTTAERFAKGGVEVARIVGADTLSFGSESGDADALIRTAALADSDAYADALRRELTSGDAFAVCRARALRSLDPDAVCDTPNDILGVEYCRALRNTGIRPLVIQRDSRHDASDPTQGVSASYLRGRIRTGHADDCRAYMPETAWNLLSRELAGAAPPAMADLDAAMLLYLRRLTAKQLADTDISEGFEHRLYRALREAGSLREAYDLAKTKRVSHARIRRACLSAYLGIPKTYAYEKPPFLRVLALNGCGRTVLRNVTQVPVLTKPAQIASFPERAQAWFALDTRAYDLTALSFAGAELTRSARYCG